MRHRLDTCRVDSLHLFDQLEDSVEVALRGEGFGFAELDAGEMGDALDLMEDSAPMREVLGQEFIAVYQAVKRNEYKEFLQVISPWEREHLLLNV